MATVALHAPARPPRNSIRRPLRTRAAAWGEKGHRSANCRPPAPSVRQGTKGWETGRSEGRRRRQQDERWRGRSRKILVGGREREGERVARRKEACRRVRVGKEASETGRVRAWVARAGEGSRAPTGGRWRRSGGRASSRARSPSAEEEGRAERKGAGAGGGGMVSNDRRLGEGRLHHAPCDDGEAERRVALGLRERPEQAAGDGSKYARGRDGRLGEAVGEVDDLGRAARRGGKGSVSSREESKGSTSRTSSRCGGRGGGAVVSACPAVEERRGRRTLSRS